MFSLWILFKPVFNSHLWFWATDIIFQIPDIIFIYNLGRFSFGTLSVLFVYFVFPFELRHQPLFFLIPLRFVIDYLTGHVLSENLKWFQALFLRIYWKQRLHQKIGQLFWAPLDHAGRLRQQCPETEFSRRWRSGKSMSSLIPNIDLKSHESTLEIWKLWGQ